MPEDLPRQGYLRSTEADRAVGSEIDGYSEVFWPPDARVGRAVSSGLRAEVSPKIAVVIPCYKCKRHIIEIINNIGPEVSVIIVVDDGCPEGTGEHVKRMVADPRVHVTFRHGNGGVGSAVKSGYLEALSRSADIIVKVDGDGQMDPRHILRFVAPIAEGYCDYTKGNRFFAVEFLRGMPATRIIGNACLSLISKVSSGYWNIIDPTNGYTAIHAKVLKALPLDKISDGYFFESDMLFRLNISGAMVSDIPVESSYGDEVSGIKIWKVLFQFSWSHLRCFQKRIVYNYFIRNFSMASLFLLLGVLFIGSGGAYGIYEFYYHASRNLPTPSGTVMLAALPIITGVQFLLSFINFDMAERPRQAMHRRL